MIHRYLRPHAHPCVFLRHASIQIVDLGVRGSSPRGGTNEIKDLSGVYAKLSVLRTVTKPVTSSLGSRNTMQV
jgi:hypothetical protein